MVLFPVAVPASSWYFEIFFAEKFLNDMAKAKRQNKMFNHRIKPSWSCHTNSEGIPERQPPLFSPSCSSAQPAKGTQEIQVHCYFCSHFQRYHQPAKSVCHLPCHIWPQQVGEPWRWAASQQDRAQHLQLHWLFSPRSWKGCQDQAFKNPNACFILMQPPFTSTATPLRHRLQARWETTNTL